MIQARPAVEQHITEVFAIHPVGTILGPKQCRKTTLALQCVQATLPSEKIHFFDLEDPRHLNALSAPALTLEPLQGLIVIDKIQRRLELLS